MGGGFLLGWVLPMWALLTMVQRQRETNELLRHMIEVERVKIEGE